MIKFSKNIFQVDTKQHILLVVNPKSGSNDKSDLIDMVRQKIQEKDWILDTFETSGENDAWKIEDQIKAITPDRILVAGGDGTINLVAHILKDYDIPIGIIPAGSANGLAHNLELPDELEAQVDVALGSNFIKIDHLKVNGHTCLHISDLGLNAELIENFENSNIRGKFGYLLQSIPTLIKSDSPFEFTIEISGKTIQQTGILLAIANAKRYGTGATINPQGRIDDGKFEVLIFKTFDTLEILKTLYDEANLNPEFAECYSTENVVISSHTPIPLQIDGEPMDKVLKVEASIYDHQLRVAIP
ncbi:diacylglycerol kinase [Subsaxibacter sp. CAU 1640]|uniref:diacylglycerol/lipid kinase family protein n=1 Tax=Subsaxibacter sp. CAU 1640 TaxID=2933271 RepID=UPI002005EFA7|nr:diacylglycerol kinase family protein [Subsaxibacter sp. CAU 1640]MCK7590885.1 diacylglycerol kinase [Subsaxibacter sp. CAU 1640]